MYDHAGSYVEIRRVYESCNKREGRYVGHLRGFAFRSNVMGAVYARTDRAWVIASLRATYILRRAVDRLEGK